MDSSHTPPSALTPRSTPKGHEVPRLPVPAFLAGAPRSCEIVNRRRLFRFIIQPGGSHDRF